MRTLAVLLVCLPVGCANPSTYDYIGICEDSSVAIDPDDASLGFSANDALSLLQASTPEVVFWDKLWLVEQEATLQMSLTRGATEPRQVTRTMEGIGSEEGCRPGPELELWVQLEVDISEGEAVGAAEVPIYVTALDLTGIYLEDVNVPLTLSGSYEAAAHEEMRAEWHVDTSIVGVEFIPHDLWLEGEVDIQGEVRGEDASGVSAWWRGHWGAPESL